MISFRSLSGLSIVFVASLLLVHISSAASGNDVLEGKGVAGVTVGLSTRKDVVRRFGKETQLVKHGAYSFEMTYPKAGMSFTYCQRDVKAEIIAITLKKPFAEATSKGIRIGKSTWGDVRRAYLGDKAEGELSEFMDEEMDSDLDLEGIMFRFVTTPKVLAGGTKGKTGIVSEIIVIEANGLRSCD